MTDNDNDPLNLMDIESLSLEETEKQLEILKKLHGDTLEQTTRQAIQAVQRITEISCALTRLALHRDTLIDDEQPPTEH